MTRAGLLGDQKYVSLTTYRRDGTPVATALWAVRDGDALAVWTVTDSWKVKRIRRNPEVVVAPCEFGGRLTGDPIPGRAEIMSAEDTRRVRQLIMRKYGLIGRLSIWGSLLRRGAAGTVGVRIVG
jgi:PPOX class probable F420-dependent enzyme